MLSACAHSGPSPADLAKTRAAEPLPRFCASDECDVVLAHDADTESCECAARRLDEALGARVDLVFDVPTGGGKAEVWVGRSVSAPESLQRCLVEHAAAWPFPSPAGGETRFRTGIVFAPADTGMCASRADAPLRHARVDKEQTRVALAARRAEVKACFEEGLGGVSELNARTVLSLMLNHDGLVIQAEVAESNLPDERVERCIVDKTYGWRLPKPTPPGVVTVSYPYSFAPGD